MPLHFTDGKVSRQLLPIIAIVLIDSLKGSMLLAVSFSGNFNILPMRSKTMIKFANFFQRKGCYENKKCQNA